MKTTIELAREAGIDAWWDSGSDWRETFNEHLKAFEALVRADERALAAPVQPAESPDDWSDWKVTPPAAQRQWVGLTDDEKQEWIDALPYDIEPRHCMILVNVMEAKLKEKNT